MYFGLIYQHFGLIQKYTVRKDFPVELEGQGRGTIIGVTRPLLQGPFYYVINLAMSKNTAD